MTRSEHPNGLVRPGGAPRTCGVCGEPGHTRRRHNGVDLPLPGELVTVEQLQPGPPDRVIPVPAGEPEPANNCDCFDDGDWHPLGSASCILRPAAPVAAGDHGTGDLLAELADGYDVQPATSDRVQALRAAVAGIPVMVEPAMPDDIVLLIAAPDPTTSEDDCRCLGSGPGDVHPVGARQCMYPAPEWVAEQDPPACPNCFGDLAAHDDGCPDAEPLDGGPIGCHRPVETVELPVENITALPYPWCTFPPPAGTVFDQPFVIREPGVYTLDETTYHADPVLGGSLSNSGGRKLSATCPAQYRHDVDKQVVEVRDVWDFGKLAHAEVLGKGAVAAVRPEQWKDYRKDAAKEWRDQVRAAGQIPITPEDYVTVKAMAAALRDHPRAVELLDQPGQREAVLAWRDPLTGAWERAMLDHLPDSPAPGQRMVIVDYKTTDKPAPDADMMRAIYNHGYHRQAAKYRKGVVLLGLAEDALMVFVFQSKQAPYLVSVVRCDPRSLQIGAIENRRALQTFADCQRNGYWPGYGDGVHELPLPRYIELQFDGEV